MMGKGLHRLHDIAPATGIALSAVFLLSGCTDGLESGDDTGESRGSSLELAPPERIANLRAIDRSVLFAEVTLRYADTVESIVAEPVRGGESWSVDLRVPGGSPYSLEVTWYDTLDGDRFDLVRFDRSFAAGFDDGALTLDFDDYDFDGYDDDGDGVTNLAEREADTLPVVEDTINCPVVPEAQSNTSGEPELTYANPVDLTDGFDVELPSYGVDTFRLNGPADGITANAGGASIRVTGSDGDFSGVNVFTIDDTSDSITARVRFSGESTAVNSDSEDDSRMSLRGVFFNVSEDSGMPGDGTDPRVGEAEIRMSLRNYLPGGFSRVLLCASIRNADGSRSDFVPGTEDGDGDGCASSDLIPDFDNDREHLIGIGVDRENKTVSFRLDGTTVEYAFDADILPAAEPRHELQVGARGEGRTAIVDLFDITTEDGGSLALESLGYFDSYRLGDNRDVLNDPDRERTVENGRLRLTGSASGTDDRVFTNLAIAGDTDFLEADLTLSSETTLTGDGSQGVVRMTGRQYNDVRNGGFDDDEGDTRAEVGVGTDTSGAVFGQACLLRIRADGSACAGFLERDSFCRRFPSALALDTPYRASIRIDRVNRRVLFTLGGERIVHDVTTNVFLPASSRHVVETRLSGSGTVVGYVDNLRTGADSDL